MSAIAGQSIPSTSSVDAEQPPVVPAQLSTVVVGNGPVGFRFIRDLVERQPLGHRKLVVFGEEPTPAYDRVNLTSFLDSEEPDSLQYEPASWYEANGIRLHTSDAVTQIDRSAKQVHSASGRVVAYDQLVLATGSRAFVPPVPGTDLQGVFAYRTIDDLAKIRTAAEGSRRAVVLGGGLLGLEAADALKRLGLQVFVVEMAPVLMPRQLDNKGADLLRKMVESQQIKILTQRQTQKIARIDEGLHVQFSNGESVVVDLVVVAAGIRPRDELARECELSIGERGGIVVDNGLQTSDPHIFAIGECAVHDGTIYGLAAPGFRMATTLADRLRGTEAAFFGSNEATRLKLIGTNVVFAGDYLDLSDSSTITHETPEAYTKLILRRNRLVGMIGVGPVLQQDRLQEAIDQQRRIYVWQRKRFQKSGRLWSSDGAGSVATWPPQSMICSCNGVTRGDLTSASERGCLNVESLAACTGATTSCGSCLPLVQQFAGQARVTGKTSRADKAVAGLSAISLVLLGLLIFAPPVTFPTTVQTAVTIWHSLLQDSFWKQVTGFSLTALLLASLLITVRKRTRILKKVGYASIRVVHVALATVALAVLIAHTGFHRGSNLNFALFTVFVAASLTGSIVGLLVGTETRLPVRFRILRRPMTLGHIFFLWPLPVLIVFHIITVYYL